MNRNRFKLRSFWLGLLAYCLTIALLAWVIYISYEKVISSQP